MLQLRAAKHLEGDAGKAGLFVMRVVQVHTACFDMRAGAAGLALSEWSGPEHYLRRGE